MTLVPACAAYEKIPPASYPPIGTASSGKFRVETADMVYRANRISVTDSTFVILEAAWMEAKGSVSYPQNPSRRTDNPDVPIILRLSDVTSVDRVETSQGRTVLFVACVAAAAYVAFLMIVWSGMADSS